MDILNRLAVIKENQQPNHIFKAPKLAMDTRDFGIGAQILHDLDIHKLRLISNTQQRKRVGLIGYGIEIVDYINY
jgi:3,4-dihydroxy 2-butanone 4-phosphate synthase/GTP cyclohydrolase II